MSGVEDESHDALDIGRPGEEPPAVKIASQAEWDAHRAALDREHEERVRAMQEHESSRGGGGRLRKIPRKQKPPADAHAHQLQQQQHGRERRRSRSRSPRPQQQHHHHRGRPPHAMMHNGHPPAVPPPWGAQVHLQELALSKLDALLRVCDDVARRVASLEAGQRALTQRLAALEQQQRLHTAASPASAGAAAAPPTGGDRGGCGGGFAWYLQQQQQQQLHEPYEPN